VSARAGLLFATLLLAAFLGAAPGLAQSDTELVIDARRLVVMVGQSQAALHYIDPAFPAEQYAEDVEGDAYSELTAAIHRFELTRARACHDNLVAPQFCGPPYNPSWLKARPADLRAALDDAGARITPFWSAACARARDKGANANLCAIE